MFERFNFYDFYGYFVPGSCTILALIAIFICGWTLIFGEIPTLPPIGLGESVLILVLAYLIGHALQSIAISLHIPRGDEKNFSRLMLLGRPLPGSERPRFSAPVLLKLHQAMGDRLGLPPIDLSSPDAGDLVQERFELAYNYVVSIRRGSYVEIYNGLYALYRGLYCVSLWGAIFVTFGLGAWLLCRIWVLLDYKEGLALPQVLALGFALVFAGLLWGTIRPFRTQFSGFARNFVDGVCFELLNASVPVFGKKNAGT